MYAAFLKYIIFSSIRRPDFESLLNGTSFIILNRAVLFLFAISNSFQIIHGKTAAFGFIIIIIIVTKNPWLNFREN